MAMPEAAVYEDRCVIFWQQQIGAAWNIAGMQPEAKALPVQSLSNNQFGLCVYAPDTGHHPASRLLVHNIRQLL